jgi:hypothetical protein
MHDVGAHNNKDNESNRYEALNCVDCFLPYIRKNILGSLDSHVKMWNRGAETTERSHFVPFRARANLPPKLVDSSFHGLHNSFTMIIITHTFYT